MGTREFSATLRKLRREKGLKQKDVARACRSMGVSMTPSMVSHLETGRRGPSSAAVVSCLAKALNLSDAETARLYASAGLSFPQPVRTESIPEELSGVLAFLTDANFTAPFFVPFVFPDAETIDLSLIQLLQLWHEHAELRLDLRRREWAHALEKSEQLDESVRTIHSRLTAYLEDVRGIAHYHQGHMARAERHFRKSKYHALQCNDERAIATGAVHLAAIYKNTARLDEAWQEYTEARQLFESLDDRRQTAWVNRKLGTWYLFQGDAKNAVKLLEESLKLFQREDERYEASHAHASLGWAYAILGMWEDAVEQYRTALALTVGLNDQRKREGGWDDTYNISRCHLYLGDSLRQVGQLAEAKQHLELARALIDENVDEQYERGRVYLCLAKLYHQMGEEYWTEAVELAEQSRDFHIARGNQMKLAQSLCHLGRLYAEVGQVDEARFCYDDAIALSQEPGVRNAYYEVAAMVNLCELHLLTGNTTRADELSREAEQRCKEHEYYQHLARLKVIQAEIAVAHADPVANGAYGRAVGYCKEAYRSAYRFNNYLAEEIHEKVCDLAAKTMQVQGLAFGQKLFTGLGEVMESGGWYLTLDRESQDRYRAQVSDLQRKVAGSGNLSKLGSSVRLSNKLT